MNSANLPDGTTPRDIDNRDWNQEDYDEWEEWYMTVAEEKFEREREKKDG